MKKLAVVVLALALSASSAAAATGQLWVGPGGGVNIPMGDFGDVASLGFFGGGTATYMLNDQFGAGLDLNYHSFGVNDDFEEAEAALAGQSVDISLHAFQVTVNGTYQLPVEGNLLPYLKVGLGIYNSGFKVESGGTSDEESNSDFGFNLGGGAMWKMNDNMSWGVEGLFHSIMTEDESSNLVTVGAKVLFGVGGK